MLSRPVAVAVECYSGYTFAERPTAFVWHGRRYQIKEILKRWRAPEGSGFRVRTSEGAQFELTYDATQDQWYLRSPVHIAGAGGEEPAADNPDRKEQDNDAQLCV
jgi:hypothetical protein